MFRILALFLLFLVPLQARAQGFVIDVPGGKEISIAVPAPQAQHSGGVVTEVHDTLLRDLELSGYFTLVDPRSYVERGKGVEPGTFNMGDWSLIDAAVLVKTRVLPAGDPGCDPNGQRMCADAFVYYVVSGDLLAKKRFRGAPSDARHLAHGIANLVVESVTGRPGFFGARLAAVGQQTGNKEIYILELDGRGVTPVTRNGSINLSPAWSPDGRSIAWTSYKKTNPDLFVKDLGSGRTRVISNVRGVNTSPAFDPTGARLALARSTGGDADLVIVDAKTGQLLKEVTRGGGIDISPHFSPDGRYLAFASERSGGSQVYIADLQTQDVQRITFQGDFNTDPVFSPDGEKIAFVGRSEGGFDIYVVDRDGRNLIRITQDSGDNEDPAWSPDGNYLVFSSTRTGRSELWLATADGRHQMALTRSGGWSQPTFMPMDLRRRR